MKNMVYKFDRGQSLKFDEGCRVHLQPFVAKGKRINYYDSTTQLEGD